VFGSVTVTMKYLTSDSRKASAIEDHYFDCSVKNGSGLSWEINGESIGEFLSGDLAKVLADSRLFYNYTATVLSLKSVPGGGYRYDSVLVISVYGHLALNVKCIDGGSGVSFSGTNTDEGEEARPAYELVNISDRNHLSVILQGSSIVENKTTRAFQCISNSTSQFWQTDNNRARVFNVTDFVRSTFYILTNDNDTLKLQGILLSNSNGRLVSILYVTDDTIDVIRCIADNVSVTFPNDFIDISTSSTFPTTSTAITGK